MANLVQNYSLALILSGSLYLANSIAALAQDKASNYKDKSESRSVSGNKEHKREEKNKDEHLLDIMQRTMTSTVDTTARWVDRFFGDPRWFDDQPTAKPRLAITEGRLDNS